MNTNNTKITSRNTENLNAYPIKISQKYQVYPAILKNCYKSQDKHCQNITIVGVCISLKVFLMRECLFNTLRVVRLKFLPLGRKLRSTYYVQLDQIYKIAKVFTKPVFNKRYSVPISKLNEKHYMYCWSISIVEVRSTEGKNVVYLRF